MEVASKWDSKELKFNTPNTVVVFSNEKPDVTELSKDRWKIFQIKDDDLIDVTDMYVKKLNNCNQWCEICSTKVWYINVCITCTASVVQVWYKK